MDIQTWITLMAVVVSAGYFIWSATAEFRGAGKCASGCGTCGSKACPAKRLERRLTRGA